MKAVMHKQVLMRLGIRYIEHESET